MKIYLDRRKIKLSPLTVRATDFTYLYLSDGSLHYNCSIIDLYDRSVVASLTDSKMTASLAIRDRFFGNSHFKKRVASSAKKSFRIDFTFGSGRTIYFSRIVACPYDNSPMERFFNTLKTELIYLYDFHSKEQLYSAIKNFAYVFYNHVRPHSFNDNLTPFQKRFV